MKLPLKEPPVMIFAIFLAGWGLLNMLQAGLTPLNNDEAYYWMYSKYPDWGFFDHPPMIALMIRAGWQLFTNELGVRLFAVLSNTVTLIILWNLSGKEMRQDKSKTILFILVIAMLPVFNVFGFIATPDSPLLLFSAVFLLAYRNFIRIDNTANSLLLGFSMAALMYSKYHGALLIMMVILSNRGLLLNRRFYLSVIFAIILFLPHLAWQLSNGIPSLRYHLIERVDGIDLSKVPGFILNILLMHNPLVLPVCLLVIFKSRTEDLFDKALRYTVWGFIIFFFLTSFRYHVQAQWTSLMAIPLMVLLFKNISVLPGSVRYLSRLSLIVLPLFLFARSVFMFDFLPVKYLKNEFHNNPVWAKEIEAIAGDRPVVFTNSYQNASVYSFYTGRFAHSLNNLNYRKNQYDIWDFEEQLNGKEVLYLPHFITQELRQKLNSYAFTYGDTLYWTIIKDFQSVQKDCAILGEDEYSISSTGINRLKVQFYNPYHCQVHPDHPELPVKFQVGLVNGERLDFKKDLVFEGDLSFPPPGDTISVEGSFVADDVPPGVYSIGICSETGYLYVTWNCRLKKAKVN